ncbi:uncharacterized protein B0H18DRAFT_1039668 [Fomitopsis serialis]|uniref:uncharacterized protein n=1 Tax=Fomitopsis serialis TaxID=139415 RepID=UPI0020084B5C|nr:uncharacterized protein B0H18DRAFT_1039668 [Neoantrodia serialis]KAH9915902.1 hypothetical protein B0H18DRAFT_1039668 [Neoantrodia serialis]
MQFIRLVAVLAALIPLMATAASARPYGMAEVLRRVPSTLPPTRSAPCADDPNFRRRSEAYTFGDIVNMPAPFTSHRSCSGC